MSLSEPNRNTLSIVSERIVEWTTARTRRPNRHRALAQAFELEGFVEPALFIIIAANLS
jgi:hypothetical protein